MYDILTSFRFFCFGYGNLFIYLFICTELHFFLKNRNITECNLQKKLSDFFFKETNLKISLCPPFICMQTHKNPDNQRFADNGKQHLASALQRTKNRTICFQCTEQHLHLQLISIQQKQSDRNTHQQAYLCPLSDAWCKGVYPELSVQFTFRPFHMLWNREMPQLINAHTHTHTHVYDCFQLYRFTTFISSAGVSVLPAATVSFSLEAGNDKPVPTNQDSHSSNVSSIESKDRWKVACGVFLRKMPFRTQIADLDTFSPSKLRMKSYRCCFTEQFLCVTVCLLVCFHIALFFTQNNLALLCKGLRVRLVISHSEETVRRS